MSSRGENSSSVGGKVIGKNASVENSLVVPGCFVRDTLPYANTDVVLSTGTDMPEGGVAKPWFGLAHCRV